MGNRILGKFYKTDRIKNPAANQKKITLGPFNYIVLFTTKLATKYLPILLILYYPFPLKKILKSYQRLQKIQLYTLVDLIPPHPVKSKAPVIYHFPSEHYYISQHNTCLSIMANDRFVISQRS